MTLSTSAVAVCCCSDSRSSFSKPRILDSDDSLIGEGFERRVLLVRERSGRAPRAAKSPRHRAA